MKTIRALLLSLPLFTAACSSSSSATQDEYAQLTPTQSAVAVDVIGGGSVSYDRTTMPSCASDGSATIVPPFPRSPPP